MRILLRQGHCRNAFASTSDEPSSTGSVLEPELLHECGPAANPLAAFHAIKAVREAIGCSLKDAKDLVESVPAVPGDLSPAKADRFRKDMAEIGGVVTLTPA